MSTKLTQDVKDQIHELVDAGLNNTEIHRKLQIGRGAVIAHANTHRNRAIQAPRNDIDPCATRDWSFKEKGDDATLGLDVDRPVSTLEELVLLAKIDLTMWRVDSWECTAWNMVTKDAAKAAHLHQLWRVAAKLKRVAPKALLDGIESFFKRFEGSQPAYHPVSYRRGNSIVEADLSDVHFGKLAWSPESGQDYDLRIAESVFNNAVEDLISEIGHLRVDRIVVPFGNDFTHSDSANNTTTGGTVVDCDGRWDKVYDIALTSKINAIRMFREIAPVKLVLVRGNHDRQTAFTMARAIREHFRNDPHTAVDVSPGLRKYELMGKTLVGYQHGEHLSDARVKDLPAIMMQEAPREWLAVAEFFEWHIGHRHSERKFTTKDVDTNIGVVTRYMLSLSAVDFWHYANHFIGSRRAAEVYWYDQSLGYKGHALALARS